MRKIEYTKRPTVAKLREDINMLPSGHFAFIKGRPFAMNAQGHGKDRFISASFHAGEIEFYGWNELKHLADRIGQEAAK